MPVCHSARFLARSLPRRCCFVVSPFCRRSSRDLDGLSLSLSSDPADQLALAPRSALIFPPPRTAVSTRRRRRPCRRAGGAGIHPCTFVKLALQRRRRRRRRRGLMRAKKERHGVRYCGRGRPPLLPRAALSLRIPARSPGPLFQHVVRGEREGERCVGRAGDEWPRRASDFDANENKWAGPKRSGVS